MAADYAPELEEIDVRLRKLERHTEEIEGMVRDRATPAATAKPASAVNEPRHADVEAWVREHFALMYTRSLGGQFRWCAQWWKHAEAISRLEALWRSWEVARLNPVGMSGWYRDHLDHHLPILLGDSGPFRACKKDQHEDPDLTQLPTEPADDGWWD